MKKIKLLNIFILIFICLFVFNIDVKAENYAYCYYNYTPNDSDFKIRKGGFCLFGCEEQATIVLQIAYHETDYPTPRFAGRLILSSDADFSDGYKREFSNEIKYDSVTCSNTSTLCFVGLPSININQIKDNSGELVCPAIWLFKETYQSGKPRYQIGLSPEIRTDSGDKYDSYEKIQYDSSYSKIKNDSNSSQTENNSELFSCNYNFDKYYSFGEWFTTSGQFGFSVTKNGEVTNIFATDLRGEEIFKYEGEKLDKCPNYIKFENKMTLTSSYISVKEGTAESHHAVYNGNISTAEENSDPSNFVTKYFDSKGKSKYVSLDKVGGNYNAILVEGSNQEAILISNIIDDDISSKLKSGNYPHYLLKKQGTNEYVLVDDKKDIESDEIYINSKYLGVIQGLGEEQIYSTCRDLFGDTFLTFLEENVFGVVRIGVIILLIVLTTFDFAKVVFVDDKEGIQNAFKNFKRRAIAAVLIFLTPTIIILIANLVGAGESVQDCAKTIRSMSTEVASDNE